MTGLTSEQVNEQIRLGHINIQADTDTTTVRDIVKQNVLTYFNLIYLILSILVIIAGSLKSLTFLPAVIINTLIGTVQEIYAKHTLDKLSVLNQSRYQVLRDGEIKDIASDQLVLGDIIFLKSGLQIPADARVVQGMINVNEALLTGEEDEIGKTEGSNLMSGSFVVNGECYAELTQVGEDSYASKLVLKARQLSKGKDSEMVGDINRIILIAGISIIPIGIALFVRSFVFTGNSFHDSILSMVAAVVGMVPQGLYLLFSAALALSAARLAGHGVLLHDMRSVETLARVDVFCVDKTGTITENRMHVTDVFITDEAGRSANKIPAIIGAYVAAMPDDNSTMEALREKFDKQCKMNITDVTPFSSKYKYSSLRTDKAEYRLGAPDILLSREIYAKYEETLHSYEEQGLRAMTFIRISGGVTSVLAIIALENPIREDAAETFAYFKEQGVRIIVISGDNPLTVSRLASRVGIEGAENYVNSSELRTAEQLIEAINTKTVFGRTTPDQKKRIVSALKKQGHKVAMTGDGVNDILAMKSADCSISMGTGSDAAKQASQIVLLESEFSRMKEIVSEGRKDINNIERSATLFLVKNIFSLLLGLFAIFMLTSYPLKPSQISLINGFNIGIPAALLALEPNDKRQKGRFIRNVLFRSMPAAITAFAVIAAMAKFGEIFRLPEDDISVAATYLLAIVTYMILIQIARPLNVFRGAVLVICPIGLVFLGRTFPGIFSLTPLSIKAIMLLVVFALLTEPLLRYLTGIFARASEHKARRKRRKQQL